MITLAGFSLQGLYYFLNLFTPIFGEYSPFVNEGYIVEKLPGMGCPRIIHPEDYLGLLSWFRAALKDQWWYSGWFLVWQNPQFQSIYSLHKQAVEEGPTCKNHASIPWKVVRVVRVGCLGHNGWIETPNTRGTWWCCSEFYNGWQSNHNVLCDIHSMHCCRWNNSCSILQCPAGCTHDSKITESGNIYCKLERYMRIQVRNLLSI